jgi:thioesterase domain-containing protein
MAAHYVAELRRQVPAAAYHLCGWSSGGVIAYEVARQMREAGLAVASLTLVDTRIPEDQDRLVTRKPALLLALFALEFGLSLDGFELSWDEIGELPPGRQLAAILEQAKAAGAVPPEVDAAQVSRYFEIFKANVQAVAGYRPAPCALRVLMLRTREPMPAGRPRAGAGFWTRSANRLRQQARDLRQRWELLVQRTHGWDRFTAGVAVQVVPGSHVSALRPPHVRVLAGRLRAHLDQIEE